MSSVRNGFPEVLQACRKAACMSQTELAQVLGIPVSQVVAQYEAGTRRFPIEKLVLLARVTGTPPLDLVKAWLENYAPEVAAAVFSPTSSLT